MRSSPSSASAYRQLPVLDAALRDAVEKATRKASIDDINEAA